MKLRALQHVPVDVVDLRQPVGRAERDHRDPPPDFPLGADVEEIEPGDVEQEAGREPDAVVGEAGQDEPDDDDAMAGQRRRQDHRASPDARVGLDRQPRPEGDRDRDALPTSVLRLAASNILPGSSGPRANHGINAPNNSAPANWNAPPDEDRTARRGPGRASSHSVHRSSAGIERAAAPHALQVGQRAARRNQLRSAARRKAHDRRGERRRRRPGRIAPPVGLGDLEPMVALDFFRRCDRVGDLDLMPQPLQALHEVEACGCCGGRGHSP